MPLSSLEQIQALAHLHNTFPKEKEKKIKCMCVSMYICTCVLCNVLLYIIYNIYYIYYIKHTYILHIIPTPTKLRN